MSKKRNDGGGIYWRREQYLLDAFLSLSKTSIKILIAFLDIRIRGKKKQAKDRKGNNREQRFINLDSLQMPY